ncbi:MAG: hypothetical protein KY468_20045, partial [Armatimonadetes bacterium]|nr:hypothetical protein [Armatimonadota bacterium]
SPDLQVRFYDSVSEELLGVLILDAKYKGGRRIWGREGGKPTNDRLSLESYLLDVHRRDREETAAGALSYEPSDTIVLGAYALYPGERFGSDLGPEERHNAEGSLGAVKVSPDGMPSEELTQLLLETLAKVQVSQTRSPAQSGPSGEPQAALEEETAIGGAVVDSPPLPGGLT